MCTAATYKTNDFYFGRTLDYEFSYGDEITVTPRNYPFNFKHTEPIESHYAIIGTAHVADGYPLYYDAVNEKGLGIAWLNLSAMRSMLSLLMIKQTSHSLSLFRGFSRNAPRLMKCRRF